MDSNPGVWGPRDTARSVVAAQGAGREKAEPRARQSAPAFADRISALRPLASARPNPGEPRLLGGGGFRPLVAALPEETEEGASQAMEGNRDEAEKCVEIAREALNAGDREKAQRFLQKAEKLYPLPSARGEALCVPSLPVQSPDRRAALPTPTIARSGDSRTSNQADPICGTRPGPAGHGLAMGCPRLPLHQPACEMPALSWQASVVASLPGPFSETVHGRRVHGRPFLALLEWAL